MVLPSYRLDIPRLNTGNLNIFGSNFSTGSGNAFANKLGGSLWGTFPSWNTSTSISSSSSSSSENKTGETYEEHKARLAKEREDELAKAAERKTKKEQEEMAKPLTESETETLKKEALEQDKNNNKKAQGSLGSAMLFPAITSVPLISKGIQGKKDVVAMFYKDGAAHMDLFNKNPEVMTNAQDAVQKLERKFARDLRAAKGNQAAIDRIVQERDVMRELVKDALATNDAKEVAKVAAQCQTGASVKNGWFKRLFRKQDKIFSRFDAVADADAAKKFSAIEAPASGKSFFKNMFSSKLSTIMAASMLVMPFVTDWGNIKQARAVDKENKGTGKETHYGRKQIIQTSIKGVSSFVCYNVVDTAVRTVAKRTLGKFAAKFAAKLAVKGGCKALGGIIGSIAPGIGNVLGIVIGAGLDFVLNKYVFGKMKFFNNTGAKEAQVEKASGEELISSLSEQYIQGGELSQGALSILERKCGSETFKELKRVHNLPEKERNEYIAQLQQQQQAALQQQQVAVA